MILDKTAQIETGLTDRPTRAHCFFEQSGTFKGEFIKLGIQAYDYDILNDYGQTDYQIDLFNEIEKAYDGEKSIFDNITQDDLIIAFFPCTRFSSKIPPWLRGESYSQRRWDDKKKLKYSIYLHDGLHRNYVLISKMAYIAIDKGLKMIIENPYNHASYLTMNWCIKPTIIDKDRRINGDKFKKPTQYFFLNFKPKNNLIFEPLDYVETRWVKWVHTNGDKTRQELRSEIHPQYANRFIRQYLIGDTDA